MSRAGQKIIDGLRDAIAGDFTAVFIDGVHWVRAPVWRPISSAPKDGTKVLVFGQWAGEINGIDDLPSIAIAHYGGSGDFADFDWIVDGTDAYAAWIMASHWMPLPSFPVQS